MTTAGKLSPGLGRPLTWVGQGRHQGQNECVPSAIQGKEVRFLRPEDPTQPSRFQQQQGLRHVVFTAETHNFPTGERDEEERRAKVPGLWAEPGIHRGPPPWGSSGMGDGACLQIAQTSPGLSLQGWPPSVVPPQARGAGSEMSSAQAVGLTW